MAPWFISFLHPIHFKKFRTCFWKAFWKHFQTGIWPLFHHFFSHIDNQVLRTYFSDTFPEIFSRHVFGHFPDRFSKQFLDIYLDRFFDSFFDKLLVRFLDWKTWNHLFALFLPISLARQLSVKFYGSSEMPFFSLYSLLDTVYISKVSYQCLSCWTGLNWFRYWAFGQRNMHHTLNFCPDQAGRKSNVSKLKSIPKVLPS